MGGLFFMRKTTRRFLYLITAISVVALLFFLSMFAPMVRTNADFSIYNTGWNGCSYLAVKTYESGSFVPNLELAQGGAMEVTQRDFTTFQVDPRETSMVFIGPDKPFGSAQAAFVHDFLEQGGRVLLADDFGSGNTLLDRLQTNSSFRNLSLFDLSFEKSPDFPVIFDLTPHNITQGVDLLLLNHPTALRADANATILANSSLASWLDGGARSRYPVISIESYGEGELILLSDPSLLINSMRDRKDNGIFSSNLFAYLSQDNRRVIFDESQRDMNLVFSLLFDYNPPSDGTVILLVAGAFVATTLLMLPIDYGTLSHYPLRFFKKREPEEDLVEKVLKENPDWDERKLNMIYQRFSNDSR